MKNTVHNDVTSSNLKGKPMTKTIGLHWLQQDTKRIPATDEASVHRAQLRVKTLFCWVVVWLCTRCTATHTDIPNVHRLTFTVSH
jgi:hypothetical protein